MKNNINIKLSQIYLETARSFINSNVRSREIEDLENDPEYHHDKSTFILGLASVSTVYSYMAIESFINNGLYELWLLSRKAYEKNSEIIRIKPAMKFDPLYKDFYEKYGKLKEFKDIRKTDLKELKERIKRLCKEYNYPQIHEANPKLWNDFTGMLEYVRHFIIHPNPEGKEFNKFSVTLINDPEIFKKYPKIAEGIISHFYVSGNKSLPPYLMNNEIFLINEIVLLK